jgi:hypothetical protein
MQTDNQNVELRIRSLRTLWIALVLSIGAYFVFTRFAPRSEDLAPNNLLSMILIVVAAATMLISFPIKSKLLTNASNGGQVQQAYIVAWAVTEVGALLGVLDYLLTPDRYYYALFLIALCGQLLHFPRSEHVINAAFRTDRESLR